MQSLWALLKKEFLLDFRQSAGINSIVVYLVSVLFATSFLFKNNFTAVSYSSVYLIIFLFSGLVASYRNFTKEENDNGLFNYIYYSPVLYVLSKMIYGIILNLVLAFLLLFLFVLFNGSLIANLELFCINILGLSIGMGALLSLMGSISSKSQGSFALMSIMSFPLLLPLLIVSAKLSIAAIQDIPLSMNWKYIVSLFSLDVIIVLLALVLFPQIWTE